MALAVATTAFGSASDAASVAVTAPTGITTGDLLLIIAYRKTSINDITSSGFTKSFADIDDLAGTIQDSNITVLYKIATSGDESATNYTVTGSTSIGFAAVVMRVTGWSVNFNPVFARGSDRVVIATSGGPFTATMASAFARPYQQLHIIAASAVDAEGFTGEISVDAYAVTSASSNPTWTEVCDLSNTYHTSGGDFGALALAYATSTDTSAVTGYSVNYSEVGLADISSGYAVGFTILTSTDASGTNALVTTTTTMFSQTGTCDGNSSNVLAEATGEAFAQSGRGTSPTQWANEAKPSTTWTNESI